MATKKKAAKPAVKKAETLTGKKPAAKKKEIKDIYTGSLRVHTGDVQAWESGKAIKCSPNTSK